MMLRTELFQPVRATAAGGNDHLPGTQLAALAAPVDDHAGADAFFQQDVLTFGLKQHLDALIQQIILNVQIKLLGLLGAKMADGAVHQLQARLNGPLADLLDVAALIDALHMGVRAEFQIDFVGIADQILRQILSDQLGQVAAHLIGQ